MITVIIYSVLIAQSSASFFEQFKGALGAVGTHVGKLFSDVGHDLKDTYDCTVHAVEEVIYSEDQISEYYNKCKDKIPESTTVTSEKVGAAPIQSITVYINPYNSVNSKEDNPKTDSISSETENNRVSKEMFKEEYDRVTNVSAMLEREYDNLSKNVHEELKIIEEEEKLAIDKTEHEIEAIHLEEELLRENIRDEISEAVKEILKNLDNSPKESALKDQIKAIVERLEINSTETILEELEKWKDKVIQHFKDMKNDATDKYHSTAEPNDIPRNFKDVAAKLSTETSTISKVNMESTVSVTESVTQSLRTITVDKKNEVSYKPTQPTTTNSNSQTTDKPTEPTTFGGPDNQSTMKPTETTTTNSDNQITTKPTYATTTIADSQTTEKSTEPSRTTPNINQTKEPTEPTTSEPNSQTTIKPIEPTTTNPNIETIKSVTTEPISQTDITTKLPLINADSHILVRIPPPPRPITTQQRHDDYDDLIPKDHKAAAEEARKLIESSKRSKSLMDAVLKSLKDAKKLLNKPKVFR